MSRARKPRGFDQQCWDDMTEGQRVLEAARHQAHRKARARRDRQDQRLQAQYDKRRRIIQREYEEAIAKARQDYIDGEHEQFGTSL